MWSIFVTNYFINHRFFFFFFSVFVLVLLCILPHQPTRRHTTHIFIYNYITSIIIIIGSPVCMTCQFPRIVNEIKKKNRDKNPATKNVIIWCIRVRVSIFTMRKTVCGTLGVSTDFNTHRFIDWKGIKETVWFCFCLNTCVSFFPVALWMFNYEILCCLIKLMLALQSFAVFYDDVWFKYSDKNAEMQVLLS